MKLQIVFLSLRERADFYHPPGFDTHSFERCQMCNWRNNQRTVTFKTDETAIE